MTKMLLSILAIGLLSYIFYRRIAILNLLKMGTYWRTVYRVDRTGQRVDKITYGPHRRQYVLLTRPPDGTKIEPTVIVYGHGGGWTFGKPDHFLGNIKFLNDLGYWVYLPSHRRLPRFRGEHLIEDMELMLKTVLKSLAEHQRSNVRFILGGVSSGAHLMALATLNEQGLRALDFPVERIVGLLLLGAPLNLDMMPPNLLLPRLAGLKGSESYSNLNPVNFIHTNINYPVLISHGSRDGIVPQQNAEDFYQKLLSVHPQLPTWYAIEGGTHVDVCYWAFEEGPLREKLLTWLNSTKNIIGENKKSR